MFPKLQSIKHKNQAKLIWSEWYKQWTVFISYCCHTLAHVVVDMHTPHDSGSRTLKARIMIIIKCKKFSLIFNPFVSVVWQRKMSHCVTSNANPVSVKNVKRLPNKKEFTPQPVVLDIMLQSFRHREAVSGDHTDKSHWRQYKLNMNISR